jgi:hypothetical protein
MGEHNSPAYRQGREHHQAQNEALQCCPPNLIDAYDPSDWHGYHTMYDRGWASIPDAVAHSCRRCADQ